VRPRGPRLPALLLYSSQFSMLETPRTTCVACIIQSNYAYWAHVGDSRLYLFRQGGLIGRTKDHSKVQYLLDQGIIGAHEVADHPDRNKIFSCLGGVVPPQIATGREFALETGEFERVGSWVHSSFPSDSNGFIG